MDITVNAYTYKHVVECQVVITTGNRSENKKLQGNGRSELFWDRMVKEDLLKEMTFEYGLKVKV